MKKYLFIVLSLIFTIQIFGQQKTVYYGEIDREIDLGLAPYIKRVVKEAEQNNADAIIFKINTFGGRVDAATEIKDAILSTDILTIAFINNRAVSAGALISLSCKKIVMAPGGAIGAATVVDQTGQKQPEKYQSYMRSEMRATAEKNGRRTDIAQGMVDERIVIPGLVDSTQLISLTTEEALKYGIADTIATSLDEVLAVFNLENAKIVTIESNWAEGVVRFLNNPVVSSILIMIGFFGLFAEVKTPGWGVPGTAGLIALALFFGSSYILELASILEIILFIIGIVLIAIEVFVIPGFGFAGISGIVLIVVSLFLSLTSDVPYLSWDDISIAVIQLSSALLLAFIGIILIAKYLPKNKTFSKLVLADSETAATGYVSYPSENELVGAEGIALTTLRPSGSAEINGERYDVMADWEYIEKGSKVKVLRVEGIKVVVKRVNND